MPEKLRLKDKFHVERLNMLGTDIKHGSVVFDTEKCKGCGLCERACFTGIIVGSRTKQPAIKKGVDALCVACGACTAICPEGAISISDFLEFCHYFRWLDRDNPQPPRRF